MCNHQRVRFCVLFLAVVLLAGCSALPPRLQESGLNSRFAFGPEVPFDAYIRMSEEMIGRARVDLNRINRAAVLEANRPFELQPDENRFPRNADGRLEKGILLVHGLSDSPYVMKPIARALQQRGFLVRAILLPGHGTVPGDLLQVTYREWIRATEYGVGQMLRQVRHLYLGGFSTGGALCIIEALKNPKIRGLMLFAPAVGIRSPWASLAGFLNIFTDWLGGEADDRDYTKYESFAVNGGVQVHALTRIMDAAFASGSRLSVPVFAVAGEQDISTDTGKLIRVFNAYVTAPESILLLYGRDGRPGQGDDGRIVHQAGYLPEERILDYAHTSLLIPPDDPHYGRNGDYRDCLHYRNERKKWMSCLQDPHLWQGEITAENLSRHTLRRLSYNPRYDEMIRVLERFLESAALSLDKKD